MNIEDIQRDNYFSKLSNHFPIKVKFDVEISSLLQQNCCKGLIYSYCKGDFGKLRETLNKTKFEPFCWSNPNKNLELWYSWLNTAISQNYQGEQRTECRYHRGLRKKHRIT